ncbi:MAG TPA: protein kinase, partial [Kiritimatiellia bacterium]|nr:protein kinase [Kiritimatiellia bacterium]
VGEGRSSVVWAARTGPDAPPVALKWLRTDEVPDESFRRRAMEEARASSRLHHPGIVDLKDVGEIDGGLYYVMEFVDGCTLAELLARKGRLQPKHAMQIAEGIALALTYAWDRERLIHHDLCPGNIMLERDGTVRVADMGILPPGGVAYRARLSYAAPEQADGSASVDYRANIYSAGALLYEMMTGRKPFRELTGVEALDRQVPEQLPDPQELNREVTSGVGWLVEKSMIRDPANRYRTWAEWLADLQEVAKGGWPLSELPVSGQSLVLRSALRFPPPVNIVEPAPTAKKFLRSRKQAPAGKRVLVPKAPSATVSAPARSRAASELARSLSAFLVLGAITAVAYAGFWLHGRWKAGAFEQETPPAEPAVLPQPDIPEDSRKMSFDGTVRPPEPAPTPAVEPKPAGAEEVITWDHPIFVRGARSFNEAVALYQKYIQDRKDPALLKEIEKKCREAIRDFESCRNEAPPEVGMAEILTQAYRLLSDCRQMMLVPDVSSDGEATPPR